MRSQVIIDKMPESLRAAINLDIPSALKALSNLEKKVLQLIIRKIGYTPFGWEELERNGSTSYTGAELKLGLVWLRQKGIIFTLRKTWGEHIYIIPRDTFAEWYRLTLHENSHSSIAAEKTERIHDHRLGLVHDLFYLLVYIAKYGLQLTQKGTIHKRNLQKIMHMMDVKDTDLEHVELQYACKDVYLPAFAIIYDAALRLGLLRQEVDQVVLHNPNALQWLGKSHTQMQETLYQLWTDLHIPSSIAMQHFTLLLDQLPCGEWFLVEPMLQALEANEMITEEQKAGFQASLDAEWLKPLIGFGLLEEGKTPEGQLAIRWTNGSEGEDKRFYIQPDYEIIVPENVPLSIRWELECIADHKQSGRVSRYLLTSNSIHLALEKNRTMQEILQFLQQHSKFGLPENIELMLKQWGNQFGQMYITEVLLLRCVDPETAQMIAEHPVCAKFITTRLGNKDFIIAHEHWNELLITLEKYGFTPRKNIQTAHDEKRDFPKLFVNDQLLNDSQIVKPNHPYDAQGLIYTKYAIQYYEYEAVYPELEEVYPQLADVPSIWLNESRAYHTSTCKEIIERAIGWNASIQLKIQGELIQFSPQSLQEGKDQEWQVRGMESLNEVCFSLGSWEAVQLILPGVNDHK